MNSLNLNRQQIARFFRNETKPKFSVPELWSVGISVTLIVASLAIWFLFDPYSRADDTSKPQVVNAVLTTLGVILGFIFVGLTIVVEQGREARSRLNSLYRPYLEFLAAGRSGLGLFAEPPVQNLKKVTDVVFDYLVAGSEGIQPFIIELYAKLSNLAHTVQIIFDVTEKGIPISVQRQTLFAKDPVLFQLLTNYDETPLREPENFFLYLMDTAKMWRQPDLANVKVPVASPIRDSVSGWMDALNDKLWLDLVSDTLTSARRLKSTTGTLLWVTIGFFVLSILLGLWVSLAIPKVVKWELGAYLLTFIVSICFFLVYLGRILTD